MFYQWWKNSKTAQLECTYDGNAWQLRNARRPRRSDRPTIELMQYVDVHELREFIPRRHGQITKIGAGLKYPHVMNIAPYIVLGLLFGAVLLWLTLGWLLDAVTLPVAAGAGDLGCISSMSLISAQVFLLDISMT